MIVVNGEHTVQAGIGRSKGFTSTGHFIVHDTKADTVELVPPKYILNVYKSLKDIENTQSEYQRLLFLYVKEIQEAGGSTEKQTQRINEIFQMYESASSSSSDSESDASITTRRIGRKQLLMGECIGQSSLIYRRPFLPQASKAVSYYVSLGRRAV